MDLLPSWIKSTIPIKTTKSTKSIKSIILIKSDKHLKSITSFKPIKRINLIKSTKSANRNIPTKSTKTINQIKSRHRYNGPTSVTMLHGVRTTEPKNKNRNTKSKFEQMSIILWTYERIRQGVLRERIWAVRGGY